MFLLHLHWWATDLRQTLNFPSSFLRGLHMVLLAGQPVTVRPEDVVANAVLDVERLIEDAQRAR